MPLWPVHRVRDPATDRWSTPIGAWLGVPVRLHVSFVAVLLLAAGAAVQAASFELGLMLAVFVGSLALHEAAHAIAAWRLGGAVEGVVLSPIGGLRGPRLRVDPEARVFVAMAGPMANLAIVVLGVMYLAARNEPALPTLFLPQLDASLSPVIATDSLGGIDPLLRLAQIAIWVNWPLFALNLLPAFPFDGGDAARSLLSPRMGSATATDVVAQIALLSGIALVVLAAVVEGAPGAWPAPSALLALLGVVLGFGSRRDLIVARERRRETGPLAYPSDDAGYDLLSDHLDGGGEDQMVLLEVSRHAGHDGPAGGPHARRGDPRDESDDEDRLDDILKKVHHGGLDGLTPEERGVLDRASDRLRRLRRRD